MSLNCKNPYVNGGGAFGCGQCLPCRVNRRRVWTHRLLLEASCWEKNAFLTLTYDDDHLPKDGSLDPYHLKAFMRELRKQMAPERVRFYGVGEYGDNTWRPHYHLALFNVPSCSRGFSSWRGRGRTSRCCSVCEAMRELWGRGSVFLGTLGPDSAGYVAGYVTKKLTAKDDPRLEGRKPEFARMSNRPGIGALAMDEVASTILEHGLETRLEDVPIGLAHGKTNLPLGQYLRRRLRTRIGRSEKAPESTIKKMVEELQPMREAAHASAVPGSKAFAFWGALVDQGKVRRRKLDWRIRNRSRRREL